MSYYSFPKGDSHPGPHKRSDETPSRQVTILPSYKGPLAMKTLTAYQEPPHAKSMQETQVSLCLNGLDHHNWTLYNFVNGGQYSQDLIKQCCDTHISDYPSDPAAAGQLPLHHPVRQDPREYFMRLFEIHIRLMLGEYRHAERWAMNEVKQYVLPLHLDH